MKFKLILEELLTELSGDEIYHKFYSKIPYEDYVKIVSIDPQTKIVDGKIEKLGKYTKLFLVMYLKGTLKMEDASKASEYLGYVYNHNIPLDINKIQSIGDLYNLTKDYIVKDTKDLSQILKVLDESEFKVLYNGNDWYIFQPLTEKASCYLGVNTEWCTTWGPHSINKNHKDRHSQFNSYNQRGPLYIIINKSDNNIKYQFNFESGQYMDPSDRKINTGDLFKKNPELLKYFFPSFYGKVSEDQLKLEIKRMDVLSNDLMLKLVDQMVDGTKNPIILSILNYNDEELNQYIVDDDLVEVMSVGDRVEFEVKEYRQDIDIVDSILNNYEYDSNRGDEVVYESLSGYPLDEYMSDELLKYFKEFYDVKKDWISDTMGIKDFETFKRYYFDNFIGSDEIQTSFYESISEKTAPAHDDAVNDRINEIKKTIIFRHKLFEVNMTTIIKTIIRKDIQKIGPDESWSFWDFMDEVCYEGNLPTEYEPIYDYETTYPVYSDNDSMSIKIDEYFENIVDEYYSSDYGVDGHPCHEFRNKLDNILKKFFKKDTYGFYKYEDENIMVQLKSLGIDCDKGTVPVLYLNKQTGETYGHHRTPDSVKIDNLVSMVTNYKLFEQVLKFNKNIK